MRKIIIVVAILSISIMLISLNACGDSADMPNIDSEHNYSNGVCVDCGLKADLWDGSTAMKFHNGDGTKGNPYIISTGSELSYFAQCSKNISFAEKYIVLNNNIDLNGKEWMGIKEFYGNFDGNGYSIFSWKMLNGSGFFEYVGGSVQNLKLNKFYIKNTTNDSGCGCSGDCSSGQSTNIGGIVGELKGYISSCVVEDGKLYGSSKIELAIGGIAGKASGTIKNCYSNIEIQGVQKGGGVRIYGGGIAGENPSINSKSLSITNCYSLSKISGKCSSVWDCAGCYQYYGSKVGGIIGFLYSGSIQDTYVLGEVNSDSSESAIGCIAGSLWTNNMLKYCYVIEGHIIKNNGNIINIESAHDGKNVIQSSLIGTLEVLKTKWDADIWQFEGYNHPKLRCFINHS